MGKTYLANPIGERYDYIFHIDDFLPLEMKTEEQLAQAGECTL